MSEIKCDILICGGGLAGLSLLYRAIKSGVWKNEQIIVIDKSDKLENDKTWSFWKKDTVDFEEIIYHQWSDLYFVSNAGKKTHLETKGYTYNSIRSIDFYNYVLNYLRQFKNIQFVTGDILSCSSTADEGTVVTNSGTFKGNYIFNSIYHVLDPVRNEQYFMQHFKGWRIKTGCPIPAVSTAYLMDFRTGQEHGTTFFYTLPMGADELFVEYTLFTKTLLESEEYDQQIRSYLAGVLKIDSYQVLEEEYGVIPMTDHQFKRFEGRIINIGTAGGDTRASTGYTFMNTQKTIAKILQSFKEQGHPFFTGETTALKHQLYDTTLLNVLDKGKYAGHQLFSDLFHHTKAHYIFGFLDAETNVLQDLQIMKSLRVMPFLQSFLKAVYHKISN
jgi:lycopene beta-cyclase